MDTPLDNAARCGTSVFIRADVLEGLILDDPRPPRITPALLPPPIPAPPPPNAPVPLVPATFRFRVRFHP
jgi:hypothetical protein